MPVEDHEHEQALGRERDAQARIAELEGLLAKAEQRLARIGEIELELRELTGELAVVRAQRDEARELVARADRVREGIQSSVSWRVTKPLRAIKRS